MKIENGGKIVLESRSEVDLLQGICEKALKAPGITEAEREAARELAALMERLWYDW